MRVQPKPCLSAVQQTAKNTGQIQFSSMNPWLLPLDLSFIGCSPTTIKQQIHCWLLFEKKTDGNSGWHHWPNMAMTISVQKCHQAYPVGLFTNRSWPHICHFVAVAWRIFMTSSSKWPENKITRFALHRFQWGPALCSTHRIWDMWIQPKGEDHPNTIISKYTGTHDLRLTYLTL